MNYYSIPSGAEGTILLNIVNLVFTLNRREIALNHHISFMEFCKAKLLRSY